MADERDPFKDSGTDPGWDPNVNPWDWAGYKVPNYAGVGGKDDPGFDPNVAIYDWTNGGTTKAPGADAGGNGGLTPGGHNALFAPLYNKDFTHEAYYQWLAGIPGGTDSAFARYAASQYAPQMAMYMKATETQPDLNWQDYLSDDLQNHLRQNFGMLSSSQRGEQWGGNVYAGRWVG